MDTSFCLRALYRAQEVAGCAPEILNTDQGSQCQTAKRFQKCAATLHGRRQFTSEEWIGAVKALGAKVSMDGRGRWMDNVFIERFWRSIKYEKLRLWSYRDIPELGAHIGEWMVYYNHQRHHQALGYETPWSLYRPQEMGAAA